MSVLKTGLAHPIRMRGIFTYLLHAKGQRENIEVLERRLSPEKLVEDKNSPRPMFNDSLRESIKCGLLIREDEEIALNPQLPEDVRNPQLGGKLLPDTLSDLLFASDNEDEEDFGRVCAWYLAQDIYDAPGSWTEVEEKISEQKLGDFLKMSSDRLFVQMDDWMCYLGFAWHHALGGGKITVPEPTAYIRRNLKPLFNEQREMLITDFVSKLAKKCPLFETGKFREEIEKNIALRQPNYLSTSTAFALFRLQDEGCIELVIKSDATLMLLPKINNQVDDGGRISHIIWQGEKP
jgi:hypothetical protein